MAELKFDMQRLAADVAEMVLDETEYKGRTIREWCDDISSGEYVKAGLPRFELVYTWDMSNERFIRCTHCDAIFSHILHFGKAWQFCPICGVKCSLPEREYEHG